MSATPPQPDDSPTTLRLAGLRDRRAWAGRESDLKSLVDARREDLTRTHKSLGGAGQAFDSVVRELASDRLADACMIEGVRGGVLSVRAGSSAVRYELDRLLRSGAETQIIRRAGTGISRIRVR